MIPRSITLKDVAREAGISVSCAARALKGRPDISEATVHHVQQIARKIGYRPDPMLSALATYRESKRSVAFQGTLSYLETSGEIAERLRRRDSVDLIRGAKEQAQALGYQLEFFQIGRSKSSRNSVWKILKARGILGGVLRSFPLDPDTIEIPYRGFTCVNLFSELHARSMPTVTSHHAQSMELALHQLKALGYQRPGMVLDSKISFALHHGWWMAFKMYSQLFARTFEFIHEDQPVPQKRLLSWIKKSKVDALVFCISENLIPSSLHSPKGKFRNIGVISLDLLDPYCGLAGIYQDRFQGGAKAVTLLHSLLATRTLTIKPEPHAIMIPGKWIPGTTLPPSSDARPNVP